MTPADQTDLLNRASPAYRAAVLAPQRVAGAVQFSSLAVAVRHDRGGACVLRATVDVGQYVEIRMPAGYDCLVTRRRAAQEPAAMETEVADA